MIPPPPIAVDADVAAAMFGMSAQSWRRKAKAGLVPAPGRMGPMLRWDVADLKAWSAAGMPTKWTRGDSPTPLDPQVPSTEGEVDNETTDLGTLCGPPEGVPTEDDQTVEEVADELMRKRKKKKTRQRRLPKP